ncbi:MAG TPA: hypothetical protein VGH25_02595 [Dongiaceae bacterium]
MLPIITHLWHLGDSGDTMAKTPKGTQDHAKHFQREDHAHAAHQEQAQRDHVQKPDPKVEKGWKKKPGQPSHPMEQTPRGPRRGQ